MESPDVSAGELEPVAPPEAEAEAGEGELGRRRSFRTGFIVGAVVAVAVGLLIVQNSESVQLDWVVFDFEAPLWIMLFVTLVAGGLIAELGRPLIRRSLAKSKEERRRRKAASKP